MAILESLKDKQSDLKKINRDIVELLSEDELENEVPQSDEIDTNIRLGMVKSCLKKSIGREKLSFTELLTALFEVQNVLNNHPLCFVYDVDVSDVLTPNCLLYGRNLDRENKIVEEIDFGVIEGSDLYRDLWERKVTLQIVVGHFWSVWYREYLLGLREQTCKSLGRGAAVIKVGDFVVIGEDLCIYFNLFIVDKFYFILQLD